METAASDVPLSKASFLKKLEHISVFEQNGKRAVHKPLLILMALAKFQAGNHGLLAFPEIEDELTKLIREFGTTGNAHRPRAHYPFWYLRSDRFWVVPDTTGLEVRKNKPEPKITSLRENNTTGGFSDSVRQLLIRDPTVIEEAARLVLERCFPETVREDVQAAVGLDMSLIVKRTKRDGKFRENVLRAYGYTCAICGFDGRVDGRLVGIEAAHIKWVEADGPNEVPNGIAMCSLHHKLFDTGAFTVEALSQRIHISNLLSGNSHPVRQLFDRNGESILLPLDGRMFPHKNYLSWHTSQVFKGA